MRVLVTGSAGHVGEVLMRTLPLAGHEPFGLDVKESPFTHHVESIVDRGFRPAPPIQEIKKLAPFTPRVAPGAAP